MAEDLWTEPIGQRLKRLRLERGLSQRDVASLGVSYAYVSRIEAGTRTPSHKAMRRLASKLDVPVEYLETGRGIGDAEDRERRLADAELELRLAGDLESAVGKLVGVLEEAEAARDRPAALRAKISLGLAAAQRGRNLEAVELLEEVTSEEHAPPPHLRPDLYVTLAQSFASLGAPDRAVAVLERCVEDVARWTPDDVAAQVRFATFLSYALTDAGHYERAEEVVQEALAQAEQGGGDLYTQVRLHWSRSRLAGIEGRLSESLEHIRRAIALLETTEDTVLLARAHILAANAEIGQHEETNARRDVDRAEELFGPTPEVGDLGMLKVLQSALAPDADQAIAIAREAIALLAQHPVERAGAAWALGRGLGRRGDVGAANDAYRAAIDLMAIHSRTADALRACLEWETLLRSAGREEQAEHVASRAEGLSAAHNRLKRAAGSATVTVAGP